MNKEFIKIITFVFVVLAIIVAFPWLIETFNLKKKTTFIDNASVKLSQFTQETVTKISIKKKNEEKILTFTGDKWLINNEEADVDKIKQFFQNLADLKIKEIVSENQDNWQKFEVVPDSGLRLTITQHGRESVFFIGKSGPSVNDFYIRKSEIKNVYLVNGELRNMFDWDVDKWKKTVENQAKK